MISFLLFFSTSKTIRVKIVSVTPNNVEYRISYLSSIHYFVVSLSEKILIQKNFFFAFEATQQYRNAHKKKIG